MKTHKEELSTIQYLGKRRTQSESASAPAQDHSEDDSSDEQEDSEEETSNVEEQCAEESTPTKNQPCACLHVSGLPDFAVKEVVQSLYPSNTKLEICDKKLKGKRYALVHFESAEEATRVMKASENVNVNGEKLTVKFHK
ncbi:hypothetical protein DAPPUDRAFT_247867 [Daphnia pulex]|uniref:RRM domain-containing protein n=1 Tax=Daphnia pulex TaxID=6669 RepID=E9GT11_DAPPU|nr:hypothetical protein DAPPUDRAFT_247867 [Daphnia pulex]|eukprot:EFX77289.1 hypothetical protein DAPPUDRAFT_247867 [Daphnia pulex]